MRRLAPALALLCFASVACGDDTTGGSSTPTPTSTQTSATPSPTPITLTKAQLDAVLLTAADLGSGWVGAAPEDAEDEETTPSPGASPSDCDLDDMSRRLPDALYGREVGLTNEPTETLLSNEAEVFAPGDAAKGFAEVNRVFSTCTTFTETDGDSGERTTLTKETLDVGTYGDETFAVTLVDKSPDGFTGGLVMVRRGEVVITLAGFSSKGTPTDVLKTAVAKAVAKLDAVIAGGGVVAPASTVPTAMITPSPTSS